MLLNARQIQRVLGKERIILLAIEDITERREIENGLEKARKELEIVCPIVFVTASVLAEGIEEIKAIPNAVFMGKPINTRTFAKEISHFLK